MADQFPSLNLDSIRISNGGVSNAIWTTLSGGSPITPGCCTIYSGNSSPNSPGGINQFGTSTVSTLRGMPLIAHELTHPVQNSGLGLGFATRYLGADKLVSGISGRGNYDVTRFYPDTDLFIQNPAKIIGNESNFTYTNSNQETRYTTYDSWAELQKDMMKNRIKQLGLSNDRLQPQ
ncbi:MAG: hypothetical protein K8R21_11760 [Leptospira sp.]|nr:hypothetical protein [Leptospira sp.]